MSENKKATKFADILIRKRKEFALDSVENYHFDAYEKAVEEAIEMYKQKLEDCNLNYKEAEKKTDELYENGFYKTKEYHHFISTMFLYENKIFQNERHLESLYEMKIIYLYKSLELNISFLVRTAYPEADARSLYRIDIVKSFLKNKDINFSVLEGYQEFEELRKINNTIKHSGIMNDELKKIKEFEDKDYLDHESLELFYTRVKIKVLDFIKHLKDEVKKDLFEFSDERLDKLVRYYYEHMDEEVYLKFIEKMKDKS